VGAPTFIPFVGAWIELKDLPHDVETEAWVGLAGPLLGSAGALAVYYAYRVTDEKLPIEKLLAPGNFCPAIANDLLSAGQ
jgi:hypothetical protein